MDFREDQIKCLENAADYDYDEYKFTGLLCSVCPFSMEFNKNEKCCTSDIGLNAHYLFGSCRDAFNAWKEYHKGKSTKPNNTQEKIEILFNNFKELLIYKNKNYGDSALQPLQIFSSSKSDNQLYNRIDDKLSRIKNNQGELRKNDIADLFGYLALVMIQKDWTSFEDLKD